MKCIATAGIVIVVAVGPISAQLPGDRAPRRITEKPQEFQQTFTGVRSITALPDGRLVLTDASEKRIFLIDYLKGSASQLSRSGTGPREYQDPGGTYRAPKGGVSVYDQRQRRFLPITTSGQVQDVVALPMIPKSWGASDEGPDSFVPDSLGNLYSTGERHRAGGTPDSIPLLRTDSHGNVADTVGYLLQQESKPVPSPQAGVQMSLMVAFSPRDIWAVAPDGAVALVKSAPYRVDWYTPGKGVVRGTPIPFTPLRSTKADRDTLLARMSNPNSARVSRNGGASQPMQMPKIEPLLKDTKPAFGGQNPRIDERGRLWIERSGAADATRRVYDVIDRRGALVDRIELPEGSKLVGFDNTSMYTVRKDEDDLLHLQRFKLP